MDMISQLPEALMIHIISFLPLIDTVRLCSMSRCWRDLWLHCKTIEFDEKYFIDPKVVRILKNLELNIAASELRRMGRRNLIAYINRTLPRFHQPELFRFSVKISYKPEYDPVIKEWTKFATSRKVKELNLDFSDEEPLQAFHIVYKPQFKVPISLYENQSLRVLGLSFCRVDYFKFRSYMALTSLFLKWVHITEGLVQDMLTNCPLLEVLSLDGCQLQRKLKISSPSLNLKRLIIRDCMPLFLGIVLSAPKLLYFEYYGHMMSTFQLVDLQSLAEVHLDFTPQYTLTSTSTAIGFLWCLRGVKSLTLCTYLVKVLSLDDVMSYELPWQMLNLAHLTIKTGFQDRELLGIFHLLRSSPNLEYITFQIGYVELIDVLPPYSELEMRPKRCWVPPKFAFDRLRTVKLEGFIGSLQQMDLLGFLIEHASVLKNVILTIPNHVSSPIPWASEDLAKFQCASPNVEIVYTT